MKVIVLSSYGNTGLPKEFHCNYQNKLWRVDEELISKIENFPWIPVSSLNSINDKTKNYCYPLADGVKYIYSTPNEYTSFMVFKILDVDISRPWCIEEYDGAESVRYLDDYICVEKSLNYYCPKL